MTRTVLSPLATARVLHADLCGGRSLVPVMPPVVGLLPERGEWALGVFAQYDGVYLDYARYYGADVVCYSTGPAVIMGSPQFLAGYAIGAVVQRALLRRKAQRLSAPQWRPTPMTCTVVTNRRLWCQVDRLWVNFDHDTITGFDLHNTAMTVSFLQASPLRISGPWALCIGVAVAHLRYGPNVAARIPAVAAL